MRHLSLWRQFVDDLREARGEGGGDLGALYSVLLK